MAEGLWHARVREPRTGGAHAPIVKRAGKLAWASWHGQTGIDKETGVGE
jgi:hypothetical protein